MTKLFNTNKTLKFRRKLRVEQTDAEKKLWYYLRNHGFFELKFFRQYGVGPYIIDFYCPKKKIAIEIDGGQHIQDKIRDDERTAYLNRKGINVMRFWNHHILKDIDPVLERIRQIIFENPT